MRLGSKLGVNPFRSLPARISLFVFGATLVTSLLVTGISVQSIDTFLRGKIELKFPEIAEEANHSLNAWYDEQIRNLGVLAASDVLAPNLSSLSPGRDPAVDGGPQHDVAEYLTYVLDRFDHFDSLFILSTEGDILAWVGPNVSLPKPMLQKLLATQSAPMPRLAVVDDKFVQVVSHRIVDGDGRSLGLLNAVMPLAAVSTALRSQRLGETGEIFLSDREGIFVAVGKSNTKMGILDHPLDSASDPGTVTDYTNDAGDRVVGYAIILSQHDLTLAIEERYSEAFAPMLAAFKRVLSMNLAIVLLFGLAAFHIARSIARPIEALSETARRISEDEENVEIPETRANDEVGVLTRTFSQMTSRLASKAEALERSQAETERVVQQMRKQNAELQRASEIFEQLSITDGLTKLHNHRYFQEQLAKEVKRSDRTADPLSLILIDIDHFKKWNDHLGHAGGDEILRSIAQIMNEIVRETDILARYGGEEFGLILPKTELEGAVGLAEKVRARVAEASTVEDVPDGLEGLTVSIGVNVYRGDAVDLFSGADQALYRAKNGGRDCVIACEEVD